MQVQLEQLTSSFQSMTEDLRQRLVANVSAAFPSDDEMSPLKAGFARTEGFSLPERPTLASSGTVCVLEKQAQVQPACLTARYHARGGAANPRAQPPGPTA